MYLLWSVLCGMAGREEQESKPMGVNLALIGWIRLKARRVDDVTTLKCIKNTTGKNTMLAYMESMLSMSPAKTLQAGA